MAGHSTHCGSLALVAWLFAAVTLLFTTPATSAAASITSSPCKGAGDVGAVVPAPSGAKGLRISVDRAAAAIGTREHVGGTGWPAGQEVLITVEYDIGGGFVDSDGLLATAAVAPDGSFASSAFRLPPPECDLGSTTSWVGTAARVVARAGDVANPNGDQMAVDAPLTIVAAPSVSVEPALRQVIAGTRSLPVEGHGWGAGTQVTIGLGQAVDSGGLEPAGVALLPEAAAVVAVADAGGAFAAYVPIPANLRWGTILQVVAAANTSPYGDVALLDSGFAAPLLPPQLPRLTLTPPQGDGTTLTITGKAWWPGDTLELEACDYAPYSPANQDAVPLGSVTVRADGTFSKQLRLPPNVGVTPRVAVFAYTDDYDPTTSPFFLQSVVFGSHVMAGAQATLQVARPPWQFDLGALLGLILGVLMLIILAEPASRWWKARGGDR